MATSKVTTDHDEIRRWAEKQGGQPARVKGTGRGNDPGILRIDFPGFSGEGTLEPIDWETFFRWFDENELALIYRPSDRFNKLVSRATVAEKSRRPRQAASRTRATASRAKTRAKTRATRQGGRKRATQQTKRTRKQPARAQSRR
jgi:hypothetical protein